MLTSSIRVLIVDDFEPFRRCLASSLQNILECPNIVEASDGAQAIELAKALRPDLILLDIGLPKVDGIEAARRILELVPQTKILFVSQEISVEVVQMAFGAGASGYAAKMDAGSELPTAVRTVLRGERFVGRRFDGHRFIEASGTPEAGSSVSNKAFGQPHGQNKEIPRRHEAGFYSDDASLLDGLTQFIGAALKAGNVAIVAATQSHRDSLLPRLQVHGVDIAAAIERGKYISLDAADALSKFMFKGMPDPSRFLKLFGNLIATAAEAATREPACVAVFGECVHLLWAQGNAEAAIQVEELGNQLAKTCDVDILCGYSLGSVPGGMDSQLFQRICVAHSAVHSR